MSLFDESECAFMSTIKHMKKSHLYISLFLSCLTYKFINFRRKRFIRSFSFTLYLTVFPPTPLGSALAPKGHLITVSNRHFSLLGVALWRSNVGVSVLCSKCDANLEASIWLGSNLFLFFSSPARTSSLASLVSSAFNVDPKSLHFSPSLLLLTQSKSSF